MVLAGLPVKWVEIKFAVLLLVLFLFPALASAKGKM